MQMVSTLEVINIFCLFFEIEQAFNFTAKKIRIYIVKLCSETVSCGVLIDSSYSINTGSYGVVHLSVSVKTSSYMRAHDLFKIQNLNNTAEI